MLKENIMIYILTGIAKSGKSLVANRLIQKYSLPTFSTDYIMMMLVRGNKTLGIDPDGEDEIVANQLRPYINGLIQTMVENKVDYFIEGVHFNPDFARELLDKYPNDIKVLYLGYKDIHVEDKINELERFKESNDNPWYKNFTKEEMNTLIEYMIKESERVYQSCLLLNIDYLEISNIMLQIDSIEQYFFKSSN